MLQLKNIVKTYVTGSLTQDALKGISISFRENEFVAILGQSGSGKTTMLNIIGGLDRYTSGDLMINGVSTKQYKDRDWDHYRNHSIGFVFQSYNLIPHQSVLANVEMALTLSGVPKRERRERAITVLKKVGLADHIHKKPNQMSGGQMQRVAIARALINNPDILLADEPTGALDSETSVQIMELLKEIAKDKLVIMVTHNPELAQQYATRIVRLLDGRITDDSDPYQAEDVPAATQRRKKVSMSFLTALSLSFNNLRTKKGRTLLTAFAGSIGIIGIALILSLSTGMNRYIADIQKETMVSYPITISAETIDLSGLMGLRGQQMGALRDQGSHSDRTGVYADYRQLETSEMVSASIVENNLTAFKQYLDDPNSEIQQYLGENGVVYGYDVKFSIYSHNPAGVLVDSNADVDESSSGGFGSFAPGQMAMMGGMFTTSTAENFSELMPGIGDQAVSQVVADSYDLLYGTWPEKYNEVVLVLDRNNSIDAEALFQLGFITKTQYDEAAESIRSGEEAPLISFDYGEACGHRFYLLCAADHYIENEDGTFTAMQGTQADEEALLENATELTITGVIRPIADAQNATITTAVAYTAALTDHVIDRTAESPVVQAQQDQPNTNVLTGMQFTPASDESKAMDAKAYVSTLGISDKASLYQMIQYYSASEGAQGESATPEEAEVPADTTEQSSGEAAGETFPGYPTDGSATGYPGAAGQTPTIPMDETSMAVMLDQWLENNPDQEILVALYDQYIGESSYQDNMDTFGLVSFDAPSSISIYTDDFEGKDSIAACIENYNQSAEEDYRISYTDYVALMTSSLTTIIDGISYLLIGFVAISLVVSCIMIGIITHISVMERTKEIGILRALGASKSNISQVFNAETFIIGCCAGLLGIGVSLLALIPINRLIATLIGSEGLKAQLPAASALILIGLSIVITIIGGLLPAKKAAKKDPVIALRTE